MGEYEITGIIIGRTKNGLNQAEATRKDGSKTKYSGIRWIYFHVDLIAIPITRSEFNGFSFRPSGSGYYLTVTMTGDDLTVRKGKDRIK